MVADPSRVQIVSGWEIVQPQLALGLHRSQERHCCDLLARYALHLCGVDVAKVSKALGHASIVITLDLYGSAVEGLMD